MRELEREREREKKKEVENSILPERREQRVTLCVLNEKVNGLNRERNLLVQPYAYGWVGDLAC